MAAVTTKKPGADTGVALTFPTVYEYTYADEGRGERFAPEAPLPRTEEMPGGLDLQDDYHQQKYLDARAMAFAALASRRSADKRMMLSHANYFGMPAPVLSQRRFANPSLGNQSGAIDSARRTVTDDGAPFHCVTDGVAGSGLSGGVLRSAEGQRYGRSLLQRRVKQLDAIDAADATFSETTPVAPLSDAYPVKAQLELASAMDKLTVSVAADRETAVRFIVDDFGSVVRQIARFAVVATTEQLEDAIVSVDDALRISERRGGVGMDTVIERLRSLAVYLRGMLQGVTMTEKDRKTLSGTLLRDSGLTGLTTREPGEFQRRAAAEERAAAQRQRRREQAAARRAVAPLRQRVEARFDVPARPREEDEADEVDEGAGVGARRFAPDQRQRFGRNAGAFFGEEAPAGDAAPAVPGAAPPPPAGRGRGRASNPMRKDRSNRMSVAAATREAPVPAFASLLGRRGR